MLKQHKQSGFTLTELMVALVINTFLLAGLITFFMANLDHYRRTINTNRLTEQLQAAMDIMVNDIRRAGYWGNAQSDVGLHQNNNPFMASGADITVNNSQNCILFNYDYDNSGTLASISSSTNDERYGFRLDNQALQARPPGAAFSCTAANSAWENVTDTNIIQITALSFTLNSSTVTLGAGTTGLTMRSVDISITGRLASDNAVTKTLTTHVRIRNDKYIP